LKLLRSPMCIPYAHQCAVYRNISYSNSSTYRPLTPKRLPSLRLHSPFSAAAKRWADDDYDQFTACVPDSPQASLLFNFTSLPSLPSLLFASYDSHSGFCSALHADLPKPRCLIIMVETQLAMWIWASEAFQSFSRPRNFNGGLQADAFSRSETELAINIRKATSIGQPRLISISFVKLC